MRMWRFILTLEVSLDLLKELEAAAEQRGVSVEQMLAANLFETAVEDWTGRVGVAGQICLEETQAPPADYVGPSSEPVLTVDDRDHATSPGSDQFASGAPVEREEKGRQRPETVGLTPV